MKCPRVELRDVNVLTDPVEEILEEPRRRHLRAPRLEQLLHHRHEGFRRAEAAWPPPMNPKAAAPWPPCAPSAPISTLTCIPGMMFENWDAIWAMC